MALGCGKLKTNHYTQQGGRVVHNVGFKERNGPGREYMLMSEWVWGGRGAMALLVGRTR